jgi:hypothetical protein
MYSYPKIFYRQRIYVVAVKGARLVYLAKSKRISNRARFASLSSLLLGPFPLPGSYLLLRWY